MYQVNEALVVHDTIDDEVLVIRNDTGAYYSMMGPAADIWAGLRAGLGPDELTDLLAARYTSEADEISAAVATFLAELLDARLILDGAGPTTAIELPGPCEPRLPFAPPRLEVYTDMADLLLFDPIHEVTPDGWPNVDHGRD